jgi:hypothetical protein
MTVGVMLSVLEEIHPASNIVFTVVSPSTISISLDHPVHTYLNYGFLAILSLECLCATHPISGIS